MKVYSNQNHGVNRNANMDKVASVYDRQGVSNRAEKAKELSFSALPSYQSEVILDVMNKEASAVSQVSIEKTANVLSNPFEAFGQAKYYISSKLGIQEDIAHDLASSVVGRAQDLQQTYGGDIQPMITGIVDHLDPQQIQAKTGVAPTRKSSPGEIEEMVKGRLIQELRMTAHQADQFKKIVMQQARNLTTQLRAHDLARIASAIVDVLVEHGDPSQVYSITSSSLLKNEVGLKLNQQ